MQIVAYFINKCFFLQFYTYLCGMAKTHNPTKRKMQELIKASGYNRRQFALMLEISERNIYNIINNPGGIKLCDLVKISRLLKETPAETLNRLIM